MTVLQKPKDIGHFIRMAKACLTCDVYEELERIQCPVFVIGGSCDKVVSGTASEEIAEKLKCKIHMYEKLGHAAYEDQPKGKRMKKLRKVITFVSVLLASVCEITGCGKSEWEKTSNSIEPDEVFMFDGDRTYIDNSAMQPLITGKWVSTDRHFVIVYTEDNQVTISFDDETVLQTAADYVHLEPGGPTYTEFNLEKTELIGADGTKRGVVDCLSFEPSDDGGYMNLYFYEKETDSNAVEIILNREN